MDSAQSILAHLGGVYPQRRSAAVNDVAIQQPPIPMHRVRDGGLSMVIVDRPVADRGRKLPLDF